MRSPDTDLVILGPAQALARVPGDVVKIRQRAVDEDTAWHGYQYANSIVCMNADGAEQSDRYTHLLRIRLRGEADGSAARLGRNMAE